MFLIALTVIVILLYVYGTRNHGYWLKKGVIFEKPVPFFGNTLRVFMMKMTDSDLLYELYHKYSNEKIVGYYYANRVSLLIRDPAIIKRIMVTDFQNFHPRGFSFTKDVKEPMLLNLFAVDGDTWKLLRNRLTPLFTSAKVKAMFPLIVERAQKLQMYTAKTADTGEEVDVRDLMARYTTDFIGACAFGIDTDALTEETSTFRELGKRIFVVTKRDAFVATLKIIAPEIFKRLHLFAPEIEKNVVSLMRTVMTQRNYKPSGRNDFIDLLLELMQNGKIVGDSIEKFDANGKPEVVELDIDDQIMAAQLFVFFAAGYETSSSSTSFLLNQLAFHPEIQKKCQEEIDTVLQKHGNKLTYDAVRDMKYLEMAFRESMRMFPIVSNLNRICVKKYTIPGTDITIDEGVSIGVSLQALHNDKKYFDEPDTFRPERFHPDSINQRKDMYMPFGIGPRACVGERLGLVQSLAGVATLLKSYTFVPSKNSVKKLVTDPHSHIVQIVKGGHPLSIVSREKTE